MPSRYLGGVPRLDDENPDLLWEIFIATGRTGHLDRVLSWHPSYLKVFFFYIYLFLSFFFFRISFYLFFFFQNIFFSYFFFVFAKPFCCCSVYAAQQII